MRTILIAATAVLSAALPMSQAWAWMQRHAGGGFTHSGDAGGYQHSTTVTQQGVAHSSDAGGYEHGSAASANGVAHASDAGGAWHGSATATSSYYHQPSVVNHYGTTCVNCRPAEWGAPAALGVAAGVGTATAVATTVTAPPAGCAYRPILHRYDCGGTWLEPAYGANGVYYRVVPAP
jgi:hypothetical protein